MFDKKYTILNDSQVKYFLKHDEYKYWIHEIIREKIYINLDDYNMADNESNTGNASKDFRMDAVYINKYDTHRTIIVEVNNSGDPIGSLRKAYAYLCRVHGNSYNRRFQFSTT